MFGENKNLLNGRGAILFALAIMFLSSAGISIQATPYDFDGDGKTDIATYGFDDSEWWTLRSSDNGNNAVQFGDASLKADFPIPADYTGDGKTDIAFVRLTTNEWFILRSEDNSFYSFPFGSFSGTTNDFPVSGDFDGDGKADPAVYRQVNGTWFILKSSTGQVDIQQFGGMEDDDSPRIADYDGDGKDDIAIHRFSTGEWWINQSRDGVVVYKFTSPNLLLGGGIQPQFVPADYTGDGKADVAFFERGTGFWYILRSENPSSYYSFPFGSPGDIPAIGDYDGDGKTDVAVYRTSENVYYIQQTTDGFKAVPFGGDRDYPLPYLRYGGF